MDARTDATSLDLIGRRHGSDKSSLGHGYLASYETLFAPFRDAEITLLEVCGGDCSAIHTWLEYFTRARVVAVFAAIPDAAAGLAGHPRVDLVALPPGNMVALGSLVAACRPSIVIEDGSHRWVEQLGALLTVLPLLPPGSVHVMEDSFTLQDDAAPSYGDGAAFSPLRPILQAAASLGAARPIEVRCDGEDARKVARIVADLAQRIAFDHGFLAITRKAGTARDARAAMPASELADHHVRLDSGAPYPRLPAELVDTPGWLVDRFAQATGGLVECDIPPAAVAVLRNATVHGRGLVTAADGRIVRESLINAEHDLMVAGFMRIAGGRQYVGFDGPAGPDRRDRGPHVLLKQMWDNNYGHWIIESLPRVGLVAQVRDLRQCRFIVQDEAGPMRDVYADSLAFFGIEPAQIDFSSFGSLRVAELVYPAPLTRQPWVKAPYAMSLLEGFPAMAGERATETATPRRLFVARGTDFRRRLLNEPEIADYLARRGFEIVVPERLSFWQQVRIFSAAEVVVGVLGAGLSNLAFAPRGVTLIGLTSEFMGDDFFYDIICHKAGRYVSLHGPASQPGAGMNSDFSLPLDVLQRYV